MIEFVKKYVQYFLIGVIILFLAGEIFELCYQMFKMVTSLEKGDRLVFAEEEGGTMLKVFFSIVIGLELIDTLLPDNEHELDKVKLILLVSLIAMGRKFITIDFKYADPMQLLGLSALTLALAGSYYILKKSRTKEEEEEVKKELE